MAHQTTSRPVTVGGKPVQNYALAVATRCGEGNVPVVLRARGKSIGTAFAAANMALAMSLPLARGNVRWGEEAGPDGRPVSWVEVELVGKGVA